MCTLLTAGILVMHIQNIFKTANTSQMLVSGVLGPLFVFFPSPQTPKCADPSPLGHIHTAIGQMFSHLSVQSCLEYSWHKLFISHKFIVTVFILSMINLNYWSILWLLLDMLPSKNQIFFWWMWCITGAAIHCPLQTCSYVNDFRTNTRLLSLRPDIEFQGWRMSTAGS